jgi:hypothetical protein
VKRVLLQVTQQTREIDCYFVPPAVAFFEALVEKSLLFSRVANLNLLYRFAVQRLPEPFLIVSPNQKFKGRRWYGSCNFFQRVYG